MPKNNVSDPITDQELAFARLVLSGTMTDRHAAEAAGLHPDSAAYTKSKPRVRDYMLQHRAAVQQQLVDQDSHRSRPSRPAVEQAVEELRRLNLGREQILGRLWEIANLDPEMTRGSVSAQVKALSMIVAIEGLIPDRRTVSTQNKPAPPPVHTQIYASACPPRPSRPAVEPAVGRTQQYVQPQPPPAAGQEVAAAELQSAPGWTDGPPPIPDPTLDLTESNFPGPLNPSHTTSSPHPPMSPTVPETPDFPVMPIGVDELHAAFLDESRTSGRLLGPRTGNPDTRVPFSIKKNHFAPRR